MVRSTADGEDPSSSTVGRICSNELVTVQPEEDYEAAVDSLRQHSIRRVPVVEGFRPVGILSIGDLAVQRDSGSVLGNISAARPNT